MVLAPVLLSFNDTNPGYCLPIRDCAFKHKYISVIQQRNIAQSCHPSVVGNDRRRNVVRVFKQALHQIYQL